MGANLARRLARGGHQVVAYNRTLEKTFALAKEEPNVIATSSLDEMVTKLTPPRATWIMVPSGSATEQTVRNLMDVLTSDDVIIDGGNSYYRDTMRRAVEAEAKGIHFLDVGTSGGIWGVIEGYCIMIGGKKAIVERLHPIFETLAPAPNKGWGQVGPIGAGHFVKMVHNGIEYGLMEALAEGFEIMRAKKDFNLDLHQIAEIWQHGSVVRSWLLDLTAAVLAEGQELSNVKGWVADSGEGRWTVAEAIDNDVPAPIITLSLLMRFMSRQEDSYAAKLLAAMRKQFGGHEIKSGDENDQ